MRNNTPTWAVVATVDEHPYLVQCFVAWHLELGASAVHLYFDRPDDPAAELFEDMGGVHVTLCDGTHWQGLGKRRPEKHQIRQVRNATHAYGVTDADWLLHCDADEFLWPSQPVTSLLDAVLPWHDGAIVPVAERCFASEAAQGGLFDGAFRRPVAGGRGAAALHLRGLTGHAVGKAFARTRQGVTVSIHRPQRDEPPIELAPLAGVELLHFDGLTRLHWVYKLLRKADAFANHNGMTPTPHRQMQIDAVLDDPSATFALHDQLKVLSDAQRADLAKAGLLLEADFDPAGVVQNWFDGVAVPDAAAFDAWLTDHKAAQFPLFHALA